MPSSFILQPSTFVPDPPHTCDDCAAWNKLREPFKVYGNTFYVGTDGLSALLVTSEAGHVLLDAGLRWESCENGTCLNMVYADSLTSPSAPGFKYGKRRLESFRRSIEKVAALPCDIVLSPHPQFTQVDHKLKRRAELKGQGTDPFIDRNGCRAYAADGLKRLEARILEETK